MGTSAAPWLSVAPSPALAASPVLAVLVRASVAASAVSSSMVSPSSGSAGWKREEVGEGSRFKLNVERWSVTKMGKSNEQD